MKNNIKYHKFFIAFFIIIICYPLIAKILFSVTPLHESQLLGYYDTYEKSEFELKTFMSSEYQKNYSAWWENNFSGRTYMLKLYNECRLDVFNLGSSIVGKHNEVFPEWAVDDMFCVKSEYDFSVQENCDAMKHYIEQLQILESKLQARGIAFLLYVTPNKAHYNKTNVPFRYSIQEDSETVRAYDVFLEEITQTDLNYIDSNDVITGTYPVFYPTGVHWARTAEQEVTVKILNNLHQYIDISQISLGEVKSSTTPFWRDTDGWDLLNVFRNLDIVYYEYEEIIDRIEDKPTILIQGGSYSEGLRTAILDNEIGYVNYINYKNALFDSNTNATAFTEWDELKMDELIKTDAVVIEVNESVLNSFSNGFVDYLVEYLE